MKTASFFTYQGPGAISIARYAPRRMSDFRTYKALAPTGDMLKMAYNAYKVRYEAILAALNPHQTWDDLHALVAPHEPILLCWERPPLTARNWCHRRMIAEFFSSELGHNVQEIDRLTDQLDMLASALEYEAAQDYEPNPEIKEGPITRVK